MVRHLQRALAAGIFVWALCPGGAAARMSGPVTGGVPGVAGDGSFIHQSKSAHDAEVELRDRGGRIRAACQRVTDAAWGCRGEKAFRAGPDEDAPAVARRWAQLLGGVAELAPLDDAPFALADAFCSAVPELASAGESGCNERAEVEVLWHPGSRMIFFRYRVPTTDGDGQTDADDVWLSPAELGKRLAARARVFERRKEGAKAARALEALAWVKGEPPPIPYAPGGLYGLLRCGTLEQIHRMDQPEREADAAFERAMRDYERGSYASAARRFIAAARLVRAIPEQCDRKYGRDNRLICYTNAALALRMANRCGSGRIELLRAAGDEADIADEVRAIAVTMGIKGAKGPSCP